MENNVNISIDDLDAKEMFDDLAKMYQQQAVKNTVRQCLNLTKRTVVSELRKFTKALNKPDKYGQTLQKSIVVTMYKRIVGGSVGINKKNAYKVRWFNQGVDPNNRYRKEYKGKPFKSQKTAFTGPSSSKSNSPMLGTHFFDNGIRIAKPKVESEMSIRLNSAIEKINQKYNKH